MLLSKELNFRLSPGNRAFEQHHAAAGLENRVVFEHLLDSYRAFQTLGFCDPTDGYVGGILTIDEALLQNLECKPFFQLHSCSAENSTD
jgi:hypothetical protein